MTMKRICSLILAFTILISLCGCGGSFGSFAGGLFLRLGNILEHGRRSLPVLGSAAGYGAEFVGLVGAQLISSILAVSCVTVAFCSNFLMVQDKANGTIKDLRISPIKSSALSLSYYIATIISTLLICFIATVVCLIYLAIVGFYMSVADVIFLFLDVILVVLFGTALSSVINFFLSSQGQISAVGTIISAGYGFICGAYMPISSFGEGLQKVLSFLPGTYGTALVRTHSMQGALAEMQNQGIPAEVIESIKDSLDCNLYFFGEQVNTPTMYLILGGTIAVLIAVYVLMNSLKKQNFR